MATEETAKYALILVTIGMIGLIYYLRKKNMAAVEQAPKVAGDDVLDGGAKDPAAFDEPDDDALDEMQDLLENAAENQGLTYEE